MPRKNYFLNYGPCASSEKMARLAINRNIHDPRNARYLRPLAIAADEEMADCMAEMIYGAIADKKGNDRAFNSDEVYRQCLIDARRMLRDREYWGLFGSEEDFTLALQ
jgi:hypothetical protein